MTKRKHILLAIILTLITYLILIVLFVLANYQYDKKKFKENIPVGLDVTKTLGAKYTISFIGDCGKGAFELSESVIKKINNTGLAYLNSEIKNQKNGHNTNNNLQWSKGPYPRSWDAYGSIQCDYGSLYWPIYYIDENINLRAQAARNANEFYYATGGYDNGYIFIIFPKAKLLSVLVQIQ